MVFWTIGSFHNCIGGTNSAHHIFFTIDGFILRLAKSRQTSKNLPMIRITKHNNSLSFWYLSQLFFLQFLIYLIIDFNFMDRTFKNIIGPMLEQIAQIYHHCIIGGIYFYPMFLGIEGTKTILSKTWLLEEEGYGAVVGMSSSPGFACFMQLLWSDLWVVQVSYCLLMEIFAAFFCYKALFEFQTFLHGSQHFLMNFKEFIIHSPGNSYKLLVFRVKAQLIRSVGMPKIKSFFFFIPFTLFVQNLSPWPCIPTISFLIGHQPGSNLLLRTQLENFSRSSKSLINSFLRYAMIFNNNKANLFEIFDQLSTKVFILHVKEWYLFQFCDTLSLSFGLVYGFCLGVLHHCKIK